MSRVIIGYIVLPDDCNEEDCKLVPFKSYPLTGDKLDEATAAQIGQDLTDDIEALFLS